MDAECRATLLWVTWRGKPFDVVARCDKVVGEPAEPGSQCIGVKRISLKTEGLGLGCSIPHIRGFHAGRIG